MGHRALVAVERPDGVFDVSLAPDGAADRTLDRLLRPDEALPPECIGGSTRGRARSFDDLVERHVDPIEHEALVVVHRDGRVRPYAVLPFVLVTADGLIAGGPAGAVVELAGRDGSVLRPAYVRGWLHGTADALGETVDGGLLSPDEAIAWLADAVERLAGSRHDHHLVP